jgi:predicted peroxiredoxin
MVQALARKHLGQDFTIFERVHDGINTVQKGDVIRINTKPAVLGRVSSMLPGLAACHNSLNTYKPAAIKMCYCSAALHELPIQMGSLVEAGTTISML